MELGGVFTADSSDHRQQAAGGIVLGDEGVHYLQHVFWNLFVTGKHDDGHLRREALYFSRDLVPIHFRHMVVDNNGGDRAGCCNL